MLLGLIHPDNEAARREDRDLPGRIFERSHLSIEAIRNEIEGRIQGKAPTQEDAPAATIGPWGKEISGEIPLSSDARRVLQCAAEEADHLRHTDLGTPHLLLGLLRVEDSVAASSLAEKGMRLDKVRDDIVHLLNEEPI